MKSNKGLLSDIKNQVPHKVIRLIGYETVPNTGAKTINDIIEFDRLDCFTKAGTLRVAIRYPFERLLRTSEITDIRFEYRNRDVDGELVVVASSEYGRKGPNWVEIKASIPASKTIGEIANLLLEEGFTPDQHETMVYKLEYLFKLMGIFQESGYYKISNDIIERIAR